jgi:hypothetical protein
MGGEGVVGDVLRYVWILSVVIVVVLKCVAVVASYPKIRM